MVATHFQIEVQDVQFIEVFQRCSRCEDIQQPDYLKQTEHFNQYERRQAAGLLSCSLGVYFATSGCAHILMFHVLEEPELSIRAATVDQRLEGPRQLLHRHLLSQDHVVGGAGEKLRFTRSGIDSQSGTPRVSIYTL